MSQNDKVFTVRVIRASDVMSREELDTLSERGDITFGDANMTLVSKSRLLNMFSNGFYDIENDPIVLLPDDVFIDLEN